jgi:hypothetical protein
VAIVPETLARYADAVPLAELGASPTGFPSVGGDVETLAAFVLALDAINFGSGWFPHLRKLPGLSGYRTVEARLRARFEREGAPSARELRTLDARAVARLLEQPCEPPLDELLELFARALRDLGELVATRAGGSFAGLVEDAAGSAASLVRTLCAMPLYRDASRYDGLVVPFLKRAQLTVSDLAHALPDSLGRFRDLAELTIFADNLVPHVLRIEREELLVAGSAEEVEIRACAVDAVEQIAARMRERGRPATARDLDDWLWRRGGQPGYKARPRHRARCCYY